MHHAQLNLPILQELLFGELLVHALDFQMVLGILRATFIHIGGRRSLYLWCHA